jgi:hypothetical protein
VNVPETEAFVDSLLEECSPFDTGDRLSDLEASCIRYRLCRAVGAQLALDGLSNSEKGDLRALWRQRFGDVEFLADTTAAAIAALDIEYDAAIDGLQQTRTTELPQPYAFRRLMAFLSHEESEVAQATASLAGRALGEAPTVRSIAVLHQLADTAAELRDRLHMSGSILLQEVLLPILDAIEGMLAGYVGELSNLGSAVVEVELVSDRLPLAPADPFEVRITVRNRGTAAARELSFSVDLPDNLQNKLGPPGIKELAPGAEVHLTFLLSCSMAVATCSFGLTVRWTDDYDRSDEARFDLHAEAQRPSSWLENDSNPFQLVSIDDPKRLIGRESYLQHFLDVGRSAGSLYVTGLKRVGKTSLVKVGLTLLEQEGWLVVYIPLGSVLGPEGRASDLVFGILERLEEEATHSFPSATLEQLPAADPSQFARQASRWLRQLQRALPRGTSAAIALDDFDELPQSLRSGSEADALFLFLRALIDHNWLSLTFIGSEVLPTVLEQQAHRLNQVDPMNVENFGSREATGKLLTLPSRDRFDWTDDAIDLVHTLTGGNPYYSTLLGSRLWAALRNRRRTLAQEADVEAVATELADTENQSHFMHLWADDPQGLDAASARSIRASALLRAVARCQGDRGASAHDEEAASVAASWMPGATQQELRGSLSGLVRRGVLDEREAGRLTFRTPLVGMWLRSAGARYLNELYRNSSLASASARVIAAADYVELSRAVSFRGQRLTPLDFQAWVEQFQDKGHQYLAVQILKRLASDGYFSNDRVQEEIVPLLTAALQNGPLRGRVRRNPNSYLSHVLVLEHGAPSSSAAAFLRPMLSALRITKASVSSLADLPLRLGDDNIHVILVLDEFAGTGTQISKTVAECRSRLFESQPDWENETTIAVGLGVVADTTVVDTVAASGCEVVTGLQLGMRCRAFDPEADIFESEEDRLAAEELFRAVGRALGAPHPLGFKGQGMLVLFESNCPNNTLPALWRSGAYAGRPWTALFDRMR